ncbi:MAG: hypothetical protein CK429_35915 [Mycobacterium sp.]|nr:MAG: hypothetical protein CK429_35915 [Mycobacterium sp.]
MTGDGLRVVEGYFECPVEFVVVVSALAVEYSTVIAGQRLLIRLPSADDVTQGHDELAAPPQHYSDREDLLSGRPELAPFWGRVAVWSENFGAAKAVMVRRFGFTFDLVGDDDHVRTVGARVSEGLPVWWSAVAAWIEVRSGQDLSRLGPTTPGLKFTGASLWSKVYSLHGHPIRDGHVLPVGSSAMEVVWPDYSPIDARTLQRCIADAESIGPPETEWLLIRDAHSLCRGRDYRRAVLDAGLAAELAVTRLITESLTAAGDHGEAIDRALTRNRGLGLKCRYWVRDCGGQLPPDYKTRLVDRRNAATHAGLALPEADVRDALTVARDIVEQALPLQRA